MEEILREGKTWGIEDAIAKLRVEVGTLDSMIKQQKSQLEALEDKRNSLNIGLVILEKCLEEKLQSSKECGER